MNKTVKFSRCALSILASAFILTAAEPSLASGGVSDGGGGTTNPHPADPEWVASGVSHYSARVLIPYLNAELANYQRSTSQEQAKSPFAKLFNSPEKFFEIVKNTAVELHFSTPCLDKNGAPWDGSIYPLTPGAICISPFSMAPKLNDHNVYPETVALVLHELSHLVGTTEDEAKAIQETALSSLSQMDFIDILVAEDLLSNRRDGEIAFILQNLKMMAMVSARPSDLERVRSDLLTLRDRSLVISQFSSLLVSQNRLDQISPQFVRLQVLKSWACSEDAGEIQDVRDECKKDLYTEFGGALVSTASEILVRQAGSPLHLGPEYDGVQIKRPKNRADVNSELNQLSKFVETILNDVTSLKEVQTVVIRK